MYWVISLLCIAVAALDEVVFGPPVLSVLLTTMLCVTGGFLSLLIPSP